MADSNVSSKRASLPSAKKAASLALSNKGPKTTAIPKQLKTKAPTLTKKAKLFQSLIAFVAVCTVYESGRQMDRSSQQTLAYETYRTQLSKFLAKEDIYAKMEDYRKNEFTECVMMLAKATRTLTGADVWSKGENVRKTVTLWVAKNRSILVKYLTKTKQFDNNEVGDSVEKDDGNDDKEKETELELTIPSGGSVTEVTNALFVSLYNAEMIEKSSSKTTIIDVEDEDDEDKGEDAGAKDEEEDTLGKGDDAVEGEKSSVGVSAVAKTTAPETSMYVEVDEIEDIPQNYLGDVSFYAIKCFVLLIDDKKKQNNFLVSKLSDLIPTKSSGVVPLVGKTRSQLKAEKNELTQLNKRNYIDDKEEEEKDRRELQHAMIKRQLTSSEVSIQVQIANLLPATDPQRNEIIADVLKQTAAAKAEYAAVEEMIKERKRKRELNSAHQKSEVKKIKNELYSASSTTPTLPPTKLCFSGPSKK